MTLETDLLIDRRRLKRRLLVWRVVAVAAVIACVGLAVGTTGVAISGPHVARVRVTGVIDDNRKLVEAISAVAKDESAKAMVVIINSPGGAVFASEALYDAIAIVALKKPVVAVMGSVAASGGYMAAVAAPRIYAGDSTLTGSIGVRLSHYELSSLFGKIGVNPETLTSGAMKDQPSEAHPMSAEGRVILQALVMDLYDQFVEKVAAGRKMLPVTVRELADGRVYSGRQAQKLGLVDAIGGESEAREWLAIHDNVSAKLPVRDVQPLTRLERLIGETTDEFFGGILKTLFSQRVKLDGAMALWQPFETN